MTMYREWRKSSHSGGGDNNCVETAVTDQTTGIRDTKARDKGTLNVPAASWSNFLAAVRTDELHA